MGVYLNPGKQDFQMALNSEIFVDKTKMIRYLNALVNTNQRFISVSRPRRFGKTMAADMLCAYYDRTADSRSMFEKTLLSGFDFEETSSPDPDESCKISRLPWDYYLGKYDVIRLVMTDFIRMDCSVAKSLQRLQKRILEELSETYPSVRFDPDDFLYSMSRFYAETGTQFVVVIDEWDAVFRIRKQDKEGQTEYLNFLRDWLKGKNYVALAYMTGILPIKKYGHQSALNMFDEYSMIAPMQLAAYTGFTDGEVKGLCEQYGRDYEKMQDWYDGYMVSDAVPPDPEYEALRKMGSPVGPKRYSLYSPLSVVNAIRFGIIQNYWNNTETYEALAEYIRMDFDGLKNTIALLMDGGTVKPNLSTYQNDMTSFQSADDILALLIHLGYLGFDNMTGEAFIPNKEILNVFETSTKSREWDAVFKTYIASEKLLQATWAMDEGKVAELVEAAHDQTSNKTYHDEAALSYAIQLAYYAAQKYYTVIPELDTGKGYADVAYLPSPRYPDKPALLVELKYEKTADTAIDQIHRQKYPQRLEHYKGNILLVGINYDKEIPSTKKGFKHHRCRIEKG